MENKMKRSSRSVMRGSSYSRRSSSRNKEANSSSTTLPTTEAAIAGTGTSKNALRERTGVESLRKAHLELQAAMPTVPPNTKLTLINIIRKYIKERPERKDLSRESAKGIFGVGGSDTLCPSQYETDIDKHYSQVHQITL
ncbi:hypothetical protein SK128_005544 [Halocaridina rubra]|uniref:Uncharacterized protein n=1 Tax=Halocaridina rubra TaxID=373956 RepID=A0AAN8X3B0_HALRR